MDYICKRCGYTTQKLSNLKKHLTTKTICEPILDNIDRELLISEYANKQGNIYKCDLCNKKYKTRETLRLHKTKCIFPHDENSDMLKEIVILLKELVKKDKPSVNVKAINNTIINLGDQKHNFLYENFDYISDEYILKCAKKLDNGLVDFIKTLRFNPDHPENMNVKMHVKRDRTLYVFRNGGWEICDAQWTLEEMIIHGARIIHQKFLTNFDQEKLLEDGSSESKIQSWLLSILPRDNDKILGKLSKRLYAMILNNQNILLVEQPENNDNLLLT